MQGVVSSLYLCVRKNFLLTELDAIRRALEPKEKAAAKERQGTRTDKPGANFAQSRSGKTRKKIATQLGVSHTTLDKVAEVVDAAQGEPEKYKPLLDEMNRTGKANGVHKRLKKAQRAEEIQAEPPPLPKGPFHVIAAEMGARSVLAGKPPSIAYPEGVFL